MRTCLKCKQVKFDWKFVDVYFRDWVSGKSYLCRSCCDRVLETIEHELGRIYQDEWHLQEAKEKDRAFDFTTGVGWQLKKSPKKTPSKVQ